MVAVLSSIGIRLMPTTEQRARKLMTAKKAVIEQYRPFTIRLTEREYGDTQDIEYKSDTGYRHVGVSVCSEKREYVSAEFDLELNEVEHHNDARKYRRTRRSRKRYRAPRFGNRKRNSEWLAPSIQHRMERQIDIFNTYASVMPITKAVFEMGQFDTQLLKAVEEGKELPKGTDYQHGEQYGYDTLREAVFARDGYECQVCHKGLNDKVILRMHHIGFYKGDRTNRMANLMTVCTKCHTQANHKQGGKLYNLAPKLKTFKGASFMTSVRWKMLALLRCVRSDIDTHIQYGAKTKRTRLTYGLEKSHANDAYCIGEFHPKCRAYTRHFKKCRRNNRILEKFYDAVYTDIRDGKKHKGAELSCGRTNRREPRDGENNLRVYRGKCISKGYRSIRKQRYAIQPRTSVMYDGAVYKAKGVHCNGTRVILGNGKSVQISKVRIVRYPSGWEPAT